MKIDDACFDWANTFLGCKLLDKQIIVDTPWSTVVKINTNQRIFYLKKTPEKFSREAEIIQTLHNKFNASVPYVMAKNNEMHCFIMQDADIII